MKKYIRAMYIRGFCGKNPDIDGSAVIEFEEQPQALNAYVDTSDYDVKIVVSPKYGKERQNPGSICGWWYIENYNKEHIYNSAEDLLKYDPYEQRYFLVLKINGAKRWVEVSEEGFRRYAYEKAVLLVVDNKNRMQHAYVFSRHIKANVPEELSTYRIVGNVYEVEAYLNLAKTDNFYLIDANASKVKELEHLIAEQALEIQRLKEGQ